jgi:hypothetical protein
MAPAEWQRAAMAVAWLCAVAGCDPSLFGQPAPLSDAGTAPGASILPRPLASAAELTPGRDAGRPSSDAAVARKRDATPPAPKPFGPGETLAAERLDRRTTNGVTMVGHWEWRGVTGAAEGAPLAEQPMKAAREASELRWRIALSDAGRMRITFDSQALPLPNGSELRARTERYGTLLLWPDRRNYRVVAPGALRTLLGEQRTDVTPLTQGSVKRGGDGTHLELDTQKLTVASPLGRVELDVATLPEAGRGAPLLCRALLELMAIEPASEACRTGQVAVAAQLHWGTGDESKPGSRFVVDEITRSAELKASDFAMPPRRASRGRGLPRVPGGMFFAAKELERWRSEEQAPSDPPADPGAPESGLLVRNRTDRTLYLLLDGVPVTALRGFAERRLNGLKAGMYSLQWLSFLGEFAEAAEQVQVPARVGYELPDAGVPMRDGG